MVSIFEIFSKDIKTNLLFGNMAYISIGDQK